MNTAADALSEKRGNEMDKLNNQLFSLDDYEKSLSAVRVGKVDKDQTVRLVELAKGNRSLRSFAQTLGVNVSTLSRIMSGKTEGISSALLFRIVENAAEGSGVTIEQLMMAQGLLSDPDQVKRSIKTMREYYRILIDEILCFGYKVKLERISEFNRKILCDFELKTDALENGDSSWLVETMFYNGTQKLRLECQHWLDSVMAYLYQGGKVGRISLMVDNEVPFNYMKDRLSELIIPDEISVLLVSKNNGGFIEDEYVAPLTDGRTPKFVLWSHKVEEE